MVSIALNRLKIQIQDTYLEDEFVFKTNNILILKQKFYVKTFLDLVTLKK